MRKIDRGIAVVESILTLILLLSVLSGLWAIHAFEDMKRNIIAASYRALNDPKLVPFSTNPQGDFVTWGDPTATGIDPLPAIRQNILDDLQAGSSLFSMATNISCDVAIAYLNIQVPESASSPPPSKWGTCCEDIGGSLRTVHPSTIETPATTLHTEMLNKVNAYVSSMTGLVVNSRETLLLLDADATNQYAITTTVPTDIYLQWAPYFVWACEGNSSMLLGILPFNAFRWSGVVVPKR